MEYLALWRSLDVPQETKQEGISQQVSLGTHFARLALKFLIHCKHIISSPSTNTQNDLLENNQDLKPMSSGNLPYQGLPALGRWSTWDSAMRFFTRRALTCLGAGEQHTHSGWCVHLAGNGITHHPELHWPMPSQLLTSGCGHSLCQRSRWGGRRHRVHSRSIWREYPVLLLTLKFLQVRNFPKLLWDGSVRRV